MRDASVVETPFLDMQSGYIQRAANRFPKQGSKAPWKVLQNYLFDLAQLRYTKVDDGSMEFSNPAPAKIRKPERSTNSKGKALKASA